MKTETEKEDISEIRAMCSSGGACLADEPPVTMLAHLETPTA